MGELIRRSLGNVLFLAAIAALTGVGLTIFSVKLHDYPVTSDTLSNIAGALLAAATFGLLFEYFGKRSLINETVCVAVGEVKTSSLGVADFKQSVFEIDHRSKLKTSYALVISSRGSDSFLRNHQQEIFERLNGGKKIVFVRMADPSSMPQSGPRNRTPDKFFKDLIRQKSKFSKLIKLSETDRPLAYNFVQMDDGIWVKLYYNSEQVRYPPAFFVLRGTPLYEAYASDINELIAKSKALAL